jgi:glycosyltransferase involved in cell wall biosynthesis
MTTLIEGHVGLSHAERLVWEGHRKPHTNGNGHHKNGHNGHLHAVPHRLDAEFLRTCGWEIGEQRLVDSYQPTENHVGLGMVAPYYAFAHWRIRDEWVEHTRRHKGDAWINCRLILRLYDISYIEFNGFNAHRIMDVGLPGLCGHLQLKLHRPGTWELGEVGFLLRSGEFVPAARSTVVPCAPDCPSPRGSHEALLVTANGKIEHVGNLWDQERILRERRQPRLRKPLRIAAFSFAARGTGQDGALATFVSELGAGQSAQGHEVHVFVPGSEHFNADREVDGVHYHPLEVCLDGTVVDQARAFGAVAEKCLRSHPTFDLIHLHEWMTGFVPRLGVCPPILSVNSIEKSRRNGTPPGELSLEIEEAERLAVRNTACVLTPAWLRDLAAAQLGIDGTRVRAFPMEGRMANEWEVPLDFGQVKMGIGLGPLDRMLLFVGPLEHAAGVDLLLEALPVLLQRSGTIRVVFVGSGQMYGHLQHRMHELGVAHAVRLLGHVEGPPLTRLLRSAEAVVLPSRYRVPFDDAVVDLARRSGKPVVTTHGGPAHLVRHEENGVITYDNPGSMVWACDRVLGDPNHAERMGRNGRRTDNRGGVMWNDVAHHYLEICASLFQHLTVTDW